MSGIINSAGSKSGVIGTTELDYEEGTWTPIINGASDYSPSGYTATQEGTYTRIGNLVHVQGQMAISDKGSQSGFLRLDGLPFTTASNTSAASFAYQVGWNLSSGQELVLWIYSSNMGYFLQGNTGNTDTTQISTSQLDTASTTIFQISYTTSE